jgi:hypothetical protein
MATFARFRFVPCSILSVLIDRVPGAKVLSSHPTLLRLSSVRGTPKFNHCRVAQQYIASDVASLTVYSTRGFTSTTNTASARQRDVSAPATLALAFALAGSLMWYHLSYQVPCLENITEVADTDYSERRSSLGTHD